ncbi:MAG TPA: TIGR03435 family protein [Vicinamibacterales bacterium]|nr:TIGR03435 family protein [Vicinamibacterales bacterium]
MRTLAWLLALQVAATGSYTFEVASVKPSPPPEPNRFGFPVAATIRIVPGGRFTATHATLRDLIRRAYDVQDNRVTGGPAWIGSDRFDVAATAEAGSPDTAERMQRMLQSMLIERFKLRVHTETRQLPLYYLVPARGDGTLGPRLRKSAFDCTALRARRGPGGAPPADGSEPPCQASFKVGDGSMTIAFQGESASELARFVIPERDRPVIDKTNLPGTFDGELTFAPEPLPGFPRLPGSENGVSVYTALQEQLGLRLEPDHGPVEIIVIDGAERPTEN